MIAFGVAKLEVITDPGLINSYKIAYDLTKQRSNGKIQNTITRTFFMQEYAFADTIRKEKYRSQS